MEHWVKMISDSVILLHHFDDVDSSGVAEICEPANAEGRAMPTGIQVPINFDGRGKKLQELLATGPPRTNIHRWSYDK